MNETDTRGFLCKLRTYLPPSVSSYLNNRLLFQILGVHGHTRSDGFSCPYVYIAGTRRTSTFNLPRRRGGIRVYQPDGAPRLSVSVVSYLTMLYIIYCINTCTQNIWNHLKSISVVRYQLSSSMSSLVHTYTYYS